MNALRDDWKGLKRAWAALLDALEFAPPALVFLAAIIFPLFLLVALTPYLLIGFGFWLVYEGSWPGVAMVAVGLGATLYVARIRRKRRAEEAGA